MPRLSSAGRRLARLVIFAMAGSLVAGCAGLAPRAVMPQPEHVPARIELTRVPFFNQENDQCGPAAMAMVLAWCGEPADPLVLKKEVFSPGRKGTLQPAMLSTARRHGKVAYEVRGAVSLFSQVAAGHPVIVLQNLGLSWHPVWHYAVVVGYDFQKQTIALHSGRTPNKQVPFSVFENTWKKSDLWGLTILPPDRLPANASEKAYVEAIMGIERARQWQAAALGYQTALARWPSSLTALVGLGNASYNLGDLNTAETAFAKACRLDPRFAPAFNNHAHILAELGREQEALNAARQAVAIGGAMKDIYLKTLLEIQTRNVD